jgi:hypothetical protein|tara:strand:+ start:73 stop:1146 length:1074 start_codon:yes stop_codon:yes gene_type:complete
MRPLFLVLLLEILQTTLATDAVPAVKRSTTPRKAYHKNHEFCLFTSAGDYHNVQSWLPEPETPGTAFSPPTYPKDSYKIFVVYYGKNNFDVEHPLLQHWKHEGMKFPNFKWWYIMHGASSGCGYIAIWDDDTVTNPTDIRKLFGEIRDNKVDILGPTGGSTTDYKSLQPSGYGGLRDVEFVEMGTPVMRTSFIRRFLSEYNDHKIKDFGVDVWFSYKCVQDPACKIQVTDNVHTINPPTRSNGLREVESVDGFQEWESTWRDFALEHDMPWRPPKSAYLGPRLPVHIKIAYSLGLLVCLFVLYKLVLVATNGWARQALRRKRKFSSSADDLSKWNDDCDTSFRTWKGFMTRHRSASV